MAIDYRANYTGQDLNTQNQGYDYISRSPYLQQDFVPNVATFNISPNNLGIMGQYPQYPQYPIIPGGDGDGGPIGPTGPGYGYTGPGSTGSAKGFDIDDIGEGTIDDEDILKGPGFGIMDAVRAGGAFMFTGPFGAANSLRKSYNRNKKAEIDRINKRINEQYGDNATTGRQLDAADKAFVETGDYDEYSGLGNTNQTYSTPAPSYSYEGSDEQDRDNENTSTGGREDSDKMAYGGRAGYRDGGLTEYEVFKLGELGYDTKGGKILEPFGGINVLRDILKVNKYAYGGIVGMYR